MKQRILRFQLVETLGRLWPYLKPERRRLLVVAAATLGLTVVEVAVPILNGVGHSLRRWAIGGSIGGAQARRSATKCDADAKSAPSTLLQLHPAAESRSPRAPILVQPVQAGLLAQPWRRTRAQGLCQGSSFYTTLVKNLEEANSASELRRTPLPRTPVNRGQEEGPERDGDGSEHQKRRRHQRQGAEGWGGVLTQDAAPFLSSYSAVVSLGAVAE